MIERPLRRGAPRASGAWGRSEPLLINFNQLARPRLVSLVVGGGAAVLVLHLIAYLIQASLSVGDLRLSAGGVRARQFHGSGSLRPHLRQHAAGRGVATVLAVVVGFVMGWILSRTNVPGRAAFEQSMAMPYYVTPPMGALAWALIGSAGSGFVNQLWQAIGGRGHLIDINTPWGIAWSWPSSRARSPS